MDKPLLRQEIRKINGMWVGLVLLLGDPPVLGKKMQVGTSFPCSSGWSNWQHRLKGGIYQGIVGCTPSNVPLVLSKNPIPEHLNTMGTLGPGYAQMSLESI